MVSKDLMMHYAPTMWGFREGSDHIGSILGSFILHICKRLFLLLEVITSWPHSSNLTISPRPAYSPHYLIVFSLPFVYPGAFFNIFRRRLGNWVLQTKVMRVLSRSINLFLVLSHFSCNLFFLQSCCEPTQYSGHAS